MQARAAARSFLKQPHIWRLNQSLMSHLVLLLHCSTIESRWPLITPSPLRQRPRAIPSSVTSSDATVTTGKTAVDTALTPAAETSYTLSVTGGTVDEGDSGQSNLTYTLSLDKAAVADVVVNYSTADGTGEAGSDYDAAAGSVTFVAGQKRYCKRQNQWRHHIRVRRDCKRPFSGSNLTASVTASADLKR